MQRKITKASVEAAIRDAQKRGAKVYLWDTELWGLWFLCVSQGQCFLVGSEVEGR
jgi:hypothetical protein